MSTERDADDDSRGEAAAKPAVAEAAELEEADETAESVDRESHTVYGCGTK